MKFNKPEVKDIPQLKKKKGHKLLILKLLVITFLIACSAYGVYSFYSTYTFQNPIILRSPIIKREKDVLITPLPKKGKTSGMIIDLGKIADKIYTLESSNGKNDGCRKLGLYNGYGFFQSTFAWKCYSSHDEVRNLVINWLEDHLKGHTIEEVMCLYNTGVQGKSDCQYAINYQSL